MAPNASGDEFVVVPLRHYGRWVSAAGIGAVLAAIAYGVADADIDYHFIPQYFTSPLILDGLRGTLILTFGAMLIGVVVGTLVAVARQSVNPVLRGVASGYIFVFRGTPALVQMLIWFNLALVIKYVDIPLLYNGRTNDLITPFVAALIGLGLSESAVMAEIVRGGILSVDPGQSRAAQALGMTPALTMRRIILPQAIRVIIPPTGNETINMLKYSSLAFVVSYQELLSSAARVYTNNLKVIELLLTVTIWYLILTAILSTVQYFIEKRFSSDRDTAPTTSVARRIRQSLLTTGGPR